MLTDKMVSPTETFEIYEFALELEVLQKEIDSFATEITWNQSSGSIIIANDKTTNYITKVTGYLQSLRTDFNSIVKVYSLGITPPDKGTLYEIFSGSVRGVVSDDIENVVRPVTLQSAEVASITPRTTPTPI